MNPSLFYPEHGDLADEPKAVCAACFVQDDCRETGLREQFGVWGGLSERGRVQLRTSRRNAG
jgi:hypothetical protein